MSVYKIPLLIILIIFAIQRFYRNSSSRNRSRDIVNYLKSNSENAIELSSELDVLVVVERNVVNMLKMTDKLSFSFPNEIGVFKLLYSNKIQDNTYLFITLAKYIDFNGRRNVTHYIDLNFKLELDESDCSLKIFSDSHIELIDKNLRHDFAKNIITELNS